MNRDDDMDADTSFSYACARCGQCCRDMHIQINPYEAARLQRRLGVTTAQFRAGYTADGAGVVLARGADGACIFLGEQGCSVHGDRPLVCRLFPLGRQINALGEVRVLGARHPDPGGDFGRDGTVADFFEDQGAAPFIAAADAYFAWYVRAVAAPDAGDPAETYEDLLDMDGVLAAHARRHGTAEPADLAARTALHLDLLNRLI